MEQWQQEKEARELTSPGNALPSFVEDDGTKRNQQMAIMQYLAMKHGVVPQTADEMYEMNWYFETLKDHEKREQAPAIFTPGADQEILDAFVETWSGVYDLFEARWSDGRTHVAGNSITVADYYALATFTSITTNPNLRNPSLSQRMTAKVESCPNVMRVITSIKNELQGAVDSLNYGWI